MHETINNCAQESKEKLNRKMHELQATQKNLTNTMPCDYMSNKKKVRHECNT